MHELSVTESVLEIASRHAQQAQAARVTDIYFGDRPPIEHC
jgi:Zn finger protein HypA/HybF involved in hydrogenase expression